MDYIKEATEYLNSFNDLRLKEKNLEEKIEELEEELISVKEIDYSGLPKAKGFISGDEKLINRLSALDKYRLELDITKKQREKLVSEINNLPNYERDLLTYYYIEGFRDYKLYDKLKCSERKFYSDKLKTIRKFAIQLFGLVVIE